MSYKPFWQFAHTRNHLYICGYEKCVLLIWVLQYEADNITWWYFLHTILFTPWGSFVVKKRKRINFESVLTLKYWALNKELTYMTLRHWRKWYKRNTKSTRISEKLVHKTSKSRNGFNLVFKKSILNTANLWLV